jgi:integrase
MAGGPGPPATTAAQVETHVYPTFGDRPLGSIRPSEVQAWVRGLERDLAPSTIGVVYSFVAGIFQTVVRDRIIVASPCVDIRLPKLEPKRVEPLATERVEALIEAMRSRYRALVVLAAGTGLRQGEAFAVEVEAVDWLRRTPRVDRQFVLLPGGEPYIAPPKTPASHRTVPLPQIVVDALAAHLATFRPRGSRSWTRPTSRTRSGGGPRWCSPAGPAGRCVGPGSRTSGGVRRPLPGAATR